MAVLVDGPVDVSPFAGDFDVGFVDELAITNSVPTGPGRINQKLGEALYPPVDRDVIDFNGPFGQEFFDIAVGQAETEVPTNGQ